MSSVPTTEPVATPPALAQRVFGLVQLFAGPTSGTRKVIMLGAPMAFCLILDAVFMFLHPDKSQECFDFAKSVLIYGGGIFGVTNGIEHVANALQRPPMPGAPGVP